MQSLTLQELMFSAQIPSHTPHFLPKLSFVSVEALGHFQFPHNSLSGFPCALEDSVCLLFCPGPPFWSLSPSRTFNPSPKQSQDQHEPPATAPAQAWPGLKAFCSSQLSLANPFSAAKHCGSLLSLLKTPNLTIRKATAKPGKDPGALRRAEGPVMGPKRVLYFLIKGAACRHLSCR